MKSLRGVTKHLRRRLPSIGHGVHVPPFLQMAGHGGTVSRRTENNKLTSLCCPSRKRSPKRLKLKKVDGRTRQKNFSATIKFVPAQL